MKKIIIVGAGASGVLCSIYLKQFMNNIEVIVLERNGSPLKKVLATGNGRCNLSNKDMSITHYRSDDPDKVHSIINYDIIEEFNNLGIMTKYINDLLYPRSEQAITIRDCLYNMSVDLGVKYVFNQEVIDLNYNKKMIYTKDYDYSFDECILAFGSPAGKLSGTSFKRFDMLRKLDLEIIDLKPSLVSMKTRPILKELKGVRVKGTFSFEKHQEKGELLFTDYGVSGIAIMQLSKYFVGPSTLEIDLFNDYSDQELYKMIVERQKEVYNHFYDGMVNSKLADYLDRKNLTHPKEIVDALKHMKLEVMGLRDERYAQVMRGGLAIKEVDESLELIRYPHVYALGELLNVDGDCGGYNLHFAFACAYKAALGIERKYHD